MQILKIVELMLIHAFLNEAEEKDYENGINLDIFTPNILFIDLRSKRFQLQIRIGQGVK